MRRAGLHVIIVVIVAITGFSTIRTASPTAETDDKRTLGVSATTDGSSVANQTLSEACAPNGFSTCITAWVQGEAERVGVLATATVVADLSDPFNARWCHESLHALGKYQARQTTKVEIAVNVAAVPGVCQYGFQHGFAVGLAEQYGNEDEGSFLDLMSVMCDGFPETGQNFSSCIHGIGHAVSTVEPADLVKAASMCYVLGASQRWCVSGAVMEWGSRLGVNQIRTQGVVNLYGTCQQIAENAKDPSVLISCLDEMPALVVAASSRADALAWCDSLEVDNEAAHCGLGTGFTLANEAPATNERVIEACSTSVRTSVLGGCLKGAIEVLYPRATASDPELLAQICSAQTDSKVREICEEGLQTARDIKKTAPVI